MEPPDTKVEKTGGHFPHEYIEALGIAAFGSQEGIRLMAFLRAYLDASGTVDDSPFLVMAGYVAPIMQWVKFTKRWAKVLLDEGLSHWHMVDFNGRAGEYCGWSDKQCQRVYAKLIRIITKHVSVGVVIAIDVKAYSEIIIGKELSQRFGTNPYQCCVAACIMEINRWATENVMTQRIAYTLERGDKGQKKILKRTLERVFDDKDSCEKLRLGALTTVGKKDPEGTPCQAADILAWECRRELVEQRVEYPRELRSSLEQLLLSSTRQFILGRQALSLLVSPPPEGEEITFSEEFIQSLPSFYRRKNLR